MKGKTIRIYLVDGVPSGVLTAEIINWTGKVIVAPRSQLTELAKREEAKRTGVYCLVGPDPEQPSKELVYIGESDNVLKRLIQHDRDERKDFWSRTVLVISKDENLTKSHVRYLESQLIRMVREAGRANLTNDTQPDPNSLPEPDVADMAFFLDQVQMVLPVLGLSFTQPRPATQPAVGPTGSEQASPLFVLAQVGVNATAQEVDGEFIVFKGSTARKHGVDSWISYRSLRDKLVQEGRLIDSPNPEYYQFAENVAFSSPSAGSAVVLARNTNGRRTWLVKDTKETYEAWYQAKLAQVEGADVDGHEAGARED